MTQAHEIVAETSLERPSAAVYKLLGEVWVSTFA